MRSPTAIEGHLPLVRKIASDVRRTLGGSIDFDDLVAYGTRGLLEANERFDPARGVAFSTFAYYRIRGAIYDGLREMGWRTHSRAQARQLRFQERASHVLQQAADDAGSAGASGEAEAVENAITQVAVAYAVSVDTDALVHIADSAPSAEARVEIQGEEVHVRAALRELPEKERRLLELMYFEDKSLTEAGAALGLSKSWACRLHARALKLLGEELAQRGMEPAQPRGRSAR